MTFNRETSKAIREWLKANDFSCTCRLGNDFQYDPLDDCVYIPRTYDDSVDCDFMRCFRDLGLVTDFDTMTLSVLHEIGHFVTAVEFTEEEWFNDNIYKNVLASTELNQHELNRKYWNTQTEKVANQWAVEFANYHIEETQELENIFENLLTL